MLSKVLRWKLFLLSLLLALHVLFVNALVALVLRGQARCSNFQFIEVTCSNTDKPLKFCTSPEQITNKTLVAAYSGAFLHCDYLEGPPSSSQGKYFGYNETTIWVTYDCTVNFRICMDTVSTQEPTTSTISAVRTNAFSDTVTSDSMLSNKKLRMPTISSTSSAVSPTETRPTQQTSTSIIAVPTDQINTDTQQITPKLLSVQVPSTVPQTTEDTTFATDTYSTSSVSITTDRITTVSLTTVFLTTMPVTTVSIRVINNYEEEITIIGSDTWILGGILLAGFAVTAIVVGIPLYKLASRARRSSRVSALQN